jgi:uncharacterized protein with HEPN domain
VKDDRLYLEHIRDAIAKVRTYTAGGRDAFLRESLIQDGVIRNFEIVGEASKQLGDGVKGKHPEIPWSDIARFRDFLIHHYMGVNLKRVWGVVETHLPALQKAVEERLKSC